MSMHKLRNRLITGRLLINIDLQLTSLRLCLYNRDIININIIIIITNYYHL